MGNRRKIEHPHDPRRADGPEGPQISGPGGPHDRHQVIVDTRRAVLMDNVEVAVIEEGARGQDNALALRLAGRINQSTERVSLLFLFGTDGAAAIISELVGLFGRASGRSALYLLEEFIRDLTERMETLRREGTDA